MKTAQTKRLAALLLWAVSCLGVAPIPASALGEQCIARTGSLNDRDMEIARVAWAYFENNTQPRTGLVNAVNGYPSTTLWDTGSSLAAMISAWQIGLIDQAEFDQRVSPFLATLAELDLFNGEAPNKVYHTKTGEKVDYGNKASETGIGISILDLGRIASWLNILSCLAPQYEERARAIIEDWSFCRLVGEGQMYGMAVDENGGEIQVLQEARLGYEQYAAKAFRSMGFATELSARYDYPFATKSDIYGVPIAVDTRDSKTLGAYNYVVAESYAMDYLEHGPDDQNRPLMENIFEVQRRRWEKTGQVTAVSEDNLDREPYFVYNTIFVDGEPFKAITDTGRDMHPLKTVSTKAALSMSYVYPDRPYSRVLQEAVWDARNPKGGWYSGVYEDDALGFNKATTANTNGVVLSIFLNKLYGPPNAMCARCQRGVKISPAFHGLMKDKNACLAELPARVAAGKVRATRLKGQRAEADRREAVEKRKREIEALWSLAGNVEYAQKLQGEGRLGKAAAHIESLKGQIWKMGERYPAEAKRFQGLMGPIDTVAAKWRAGDASADAGKVRATLRELAQRIQGT